MSAVEADHIGQPQDNSPVMSRRQLLGALAGAGIAAAMRPELTSAANLVPEQLPDTDGWKDITSTDFPVPIHVKEIDGFELTTKGKDFLEFYGPRRITFIQPKYTVKATQLTEDADLQDCATNVAKDSGLIGAAIPPHSADPEIWGEPAIILVGDRQTQDPNFPTVAVRNTMFKKYGYLWELILESDKNPDVLADNFKNYRAANHTLGPATSS